jgi:hypothetical protein
LLTMANPFFKEMGDSMNAAGEKTNRPRLQRVTLSFT